MLMPAQVLMNHIQQIARIDIFSRTELALNVRYKEQSRFQITAHFPYPIEQPWHKF